MIHFHLVTWPVWCKSLSCISVRYWIMWSEAPPFSAKLDGPCYSHICALSPTTQQVCIWVWYCTVHAHKTQTLYFVTNFVLGQIFWYGLLFRFPSVISRLTECLRPGGMIILRDYGRHDMAQLRFKNGVCVSEWMSEWVSDCFYAGRCVSDNFYVRGDGTRVYFFTEGQWNFLSRSKLVLYCLAIIIFYLCIVISFSFCWVLIAHENLYYKTVFKSKC